MPIARLQKLMGHATATMTLRYMRHAPEAYLDEDAKPIAAHMKEDPEAEARANAAPIRRLDLKEGEARPVRAAWLTFPEFVLEPLEQVYRRLDATSYRYESGNGTFTAVLRTNAADFVTHYPGLWEVEHPGA